MTLTVHAADDTLATARSVSLTTGIEQEFGGTIGDGSHGNLDVDLFAVTLQAGEILTIDVDAQQLDDSSLFSSLDATLRVFDASGNQVAINQDANDPDTNNYLLDPALSFIAASTGTYTIGVSGMGNSGYNPDTAGSGVSGSTGAYRLQLLLESNAAPNAVDDSISVAENGTIDIDVLANDSDPDGDTLTLVSVSTPSHGMAYSYYDSQLNRDVVQYTANSGYIGPDSFTYTIQDEHGVQDTATVNVSVGIPNVVSAADSYEAVNDASLVIAAAQGVLANDTDADSDPLTATKIADPANGTVTLNADGSFTYTANSTFVGTDSFTYQATDGTNTGDVTTVTITVYEDAITAAGETYTVPHDAPFTVAALGILTNDWALSGNPLSAQLVSGVASGTLSLLADGSFMYTPNAGYLGSDSFTYQVTDGTNTSSPATVTLNVINTAPRGTDDFYRLSHDTTLNVAAEGVLKNDGDFEQDALTATLVSGVSNGTLQLQSTGAFTYTPSAGFVGTDSFTYRPNDGLTDGAAVTVTFTIANEAPTARNDRYTTAANTALVVAAADGLLTNDSDQEGDALTAVLDAGPTHGTLSLSGDGSFTYTPTADYFGSDSFTYHVNDGMADSPIVTVSLSVGADPPQTLADFYSIVHDQVLTVAVGTGVLVNDTATGPTMTAAVVTGPTNGTLALSADGSFTYTPNAGYTGVDEFTYTATDLFGTSRETTVVLSVTNETPAGRPESYSTRPNTALNVDAATGVLANDSDLDGDTLTASVVTSALGGISGSMTAHNNVLASSLKGIKADIKAENGASLIEAESYQGTNTAGSIYLNVERQVDGNIRSTTGDIYISAAAVGGANERSIRADAGRVGLEIFGGKEHDGGDIAGNLQADVSAQTGVAIWARGDILDNTGGSTISTETGQISITTLGKIEADIETSAGGNVGVRTWDVLDGVITARNGSSGFSDTTSNVNVFAYGSILQDIKADGRVTAVSWNNIWGDITTRGSIGVFARHDVVADLEAGRHLSIVASGDVFGDFVGGAESNDGNATIVTDSDISGTVIASKDIIVDVLGEAIAVELTARNGSALLSALGDVTSTDVSAGSNATIKTGGLIDQTTVVTGADAIVTAHGKISNLTVTARSDASVLGDADVTASTIKAGVAGSGSAVIGALDDLTNVTVSTTYGADLFAGQSANATVTVGQGGLNVIAVDDITGTFTGKQDINLTAHGKLTGVTANTLGDVSLYAGKTSIATVTSDVTATGRDLDITSLHNLDAKLTATGDLIP